MLWRGREAQTRQSLGVTGFDGYSGGLLACRGCLGPRYQTGQTHKWRKQLRHGCLTARLVDVPVVLGLMPSSLGHGVVKEGSAAKCRIRSLKING